MNSTIDQREQREELVHLKKEQHKLAQQKENRLKKKMNLASGTSGTQTKGLTFASLNTRRGRMWD